MKLRFNVSWFIGMIGCILLVVYGDTVGKYIAVAGVIYLLGVKI